MLPCLELHHIGYLARPFDTRFRGALEVGCLYAGLINVAPPLRRHRMFLLLSFDKLGVACTSTKSWEDLTYLRFEYVFPDGTLQSLRWNRPGRPGVQAWLVGSAREQGSSVEIEEIFVGDEYELNNSARYPKPATSSR